MSADPFGTRAIRAAVLDAWRAQPARFREDANAEEDHARGWYRDRVVVELAQNAADAAARAGSPGRLRLTLWSADRVLVAANTGAPLDAAGVASLASLRASAKRDDDASVGRFGVGFAAVRSVADDVAVVGTTGAVHFSLAGTVRALAGAGEAGTDGVDAGALAAEVARRGDRLPVLRLPWEGPGGTAGVAGPGDRPGDGWDTAVVLRLRDAPAVDAVRSQLDAVGDALLLALPDLTEVEVDVDGDVRRLTDVADRWAVARRRGRLDPALLADRPVEERARTAWAVTWAALRPGVAPDPVPPRVAHAPTPTDEPLTLPALLVATLPLDPTRRRVVPGPVTDAIVTEAAGAYADLLLACRDDPAAPDPLDLIPTALPAGPLDGALRAAVLAAAGEVALLRPAGDGPALRARDAVVLEGVGGEDADVLRALGRWFPALVDVPRRHRAAARLLGAGTTTLADLVEALPDLPAGQLRDLLTALWRIAVDADALEALATLPVPLADGRTVRGARGLLLPVAEVPAPVLRALAGWGVRLVAPEAAHALLERLGATPADARTLLAHPVLRRRVLEDADADEPADHDHDPAAAEGDDRAEADAPPGVDPTSHVLLRLADLVRDVPDRPLPWWGETLLPAADGEPAPARGLVLAGSRAARWFDPEVLPPLAAPVAERWGAAATTLGVRADGLAVVVVGPDGPEVDPDDVDLATAALPGWDEWRADVGLDDDAAPPGGLLAVADLDALRPDAWAEVAAALAVGEPRRAVLAEVRTPTGPAPSYTAWWLRHHAPGLGGAVAAPDATGAVAALLPPAPAWLAAVDPAVARALGAVGDAGGLDAGGWADLLAALRPGDPLAAPAAVELWRCLARWVRAHPGGGVDVEHLPALQAGRVVVAVADEVAVADPCWAQHAGVGPVLVVPADAVVAVADALDVDVAAERAPGHVTSRGRHAPTPDAARALAHAAGAAVPATWVEHEDLRVDGHAVAWWLDDGVVHATPSGLAAGLAAAAGPAGWALRERLERVLPDPAVLDDVVLGLAGEPAREA